VLVAPASSATAAFYAGPFMPAHSRANDVADATGCSASVCNEVITGKRGRPCLEYDIKRCIAPCVDTSARRRVRPRVADAAVLEGRTTS
jgi:excinuclease ABC subunit C